METKWSPKKPVLEWHSIHDYQYPMIRIGWKRCGRNGECDKVDDATTLAVRYKYEERSVVRVACVISLNVVILLCFPNSDP